MTTVLDPAVGLCSICRHARVIENRRGSRFYRCGRSDTDPSFPRYPPLPVVACRGHEAGTSQVESEENR